MHPELMTSINYARAFLRHLLDTYLINNQATSLFLYPNSYPQNERAVNGYIAIEITFSL